MAKIYVASSWRNGYQEEVVQFLTQQGHEVYDFKNPPHGNGGFAWSDIDKNWEKWNTNEFKEALRHPIAEKGFNSDFDGMKWADVCVMVLPCGRSANTEAGWMKGSGKSVYVFQPIKQEPELMYKIFDNIYDDLYHLNYAITTDKSLGRHCKTHFIMDAFKVRLVNEQFDLQEKISKLKPFIESENFKKVDDSQQKLLKEQVEVMDRYNNILVERLSLLGVN